MPRPSAIDDFTPEQRKAFEDECVRRNFKDIDGLVDWLSANGMELSRSAAYRQSSKIKQRLQTLRDATDVAKMIGESVKDEGGSLNDATISLVQAGLFNIVNKMADADEDGNGNLEKQLGMLTKAAKASSELGRASIAVKKYKTEVQARLQAAAKSAEPIAKKAGLSDADWALIRGQFLGVEVETS